MMNTTYFSVVFSLRKFHRLKRVFLFLLALIMFSYFASFFNKSNKHPHSVFWDSQNDLENKMLQAGQPKWKPEFMGQVNMHIFEDWCGGSVEQLRKNEMFPMFPHSRTTITRLAINPGWENYGLRIFGYINPRVTGEYIFAIASDDNSEFWLSSDENKKNLKRMAYLGKRGDEWAAPGEYEKFVSQISEPVQLLKKELYYFEIIYKQSEAMDHVELAWRLNNDDTHFEVISAEFLSLYSDESDLKAVDNQIIPQTAASRRLSPDSIISKSEVDMVREDPRDNSYKLPLLPDSLIETVFPQCDYYPIHIYKKMELERYDGKNYVHYSSVYPNDYTRLTTEDIKEQICFYQKDKSELGGVDVKFEQKEGNEDVHPAKDNKNNPKWNQFFNVKPLDFHSKQSDVHSCSRAGNIIMLQKEVKPIINAFRKQLNLSMNTRDLDLTRVLNIEKTSKSDVGIRYLLDMEMKDKEGKTFLMSKYFYTTEKQQSPTLPSLCYPTNFAWNRKVKVNFILTVKNQGKWVLYFIKEMERIYQDTGDKNFNIIIIDFESTDIDIEKALKNAKLPSYQFKSLTGQFAKSQAIQFGINLVEDKNSILFLCDLHIHFPSSIIDEVRKHCRQGKMVYAPIVMRLECGATVQAPRGFWETMGYGLMGIYKSDMIRIGGMNFKEFTEEWGGEDWELLDRIILNKLEVERLHLRNFLHFFHSKRGMWNNH